MGKYLKIAAVAALALAVAMVVSSLPVAFAAGKGTGHGNGVANGSGIGKGVDKVKDTASSANDAARTARGAVSKAPSKASCAPHGKHYTLNILGAPAEYAIGNYSDGHVIFVPFVGNCSISLQPGGNFSVVDPYGTDGSATLQLPGRDATTPANYTIYVRALGMPGGAMSLASGFIDEDGNAWHSLENVSLTRNKGKLSFFNMGHMKDVNASLELGSVYADTGSGPVRSGLFENPAYNYIWDVENNGMILLQMRIYVT